MFGIFKRKKEEPLKMPIRIDTDDGYLEISAYSSLPMIKIIQVHLKGKSFPLKQKMRMGLSDVEFVFDGSDVNKNTWVQTFYLSTYLPNTVKELAKILSRLGE